MTLSTSAAATRRAARRSRRSRRFARRSNQSTTVPTLDKRSNKRRKLRDQASEDIESCFYECQDRGYHDDPDIHIGHEVILNHNPFSILQPQSVDSAEDLYHSPFEFSFFCTRHSAPSSLYRNSKSPSIPGAFPVEMVCGDELPRHGYYNGTRGNESSLVSSVTSTTNAFGQVNIPGSFPISDGNRAGPDATPNTKDLRIPSPLLYHTQSHDFVLPNTTDKSPAYDFPNFETAYCYAGARPDINVTKSPLTIESPFSAINSSVSTGQAVENVGQLSQRRDIPKMQTLPQTSHRIEDVNMSSGDVLESQFDDNMCNCLAKSWTTIIETRCQSWDHDLLFPKLIERAVNDCPTYLSWDSSNIVIPLGHSPQEAGQDLRVEFQRSISMPVLNWTSADHSSEHLSTGFPQLLLPQVQKSTLDHARFEIEQSGNHSRNEESKYYTACPDFDKQPVHPNIRYDGISKAAEDTRWVCTGLLSEGDAQHMPNSETADGGLITIKSHLRESSEITNGLYARSEINLVTKTELDPGTSSGKATSVISDEEPDDGEDDEGYLTASEFGEVQPEALDEGEVEDLDWSDWEWEDGC